MTREEKIIQNGELVTEIAEQTEHLARLEAKTAKVSDVLERFATRLKKDPADLVSINTPPTHLRLPADGEPRFFDERELAGAVDLAGIFRICDDIRKTKSRLRELHEMKVKFGLT